MMLQSDVTVRKPLEDEKIIEFYWQRDERAIDETDFKYKKYLLTIAYNIVHDFLDCEECLNDTYVSAWNAIPPSRPNILRAFLTTIMRRIAVNRYHSNWKKSAVPTELTVSFAEAEPFLDECAISDNTIDTLMLGKLISDYLRTLSKRKRFIFMSRYYAVNTVDKIASSLGVSRSTVNKELAAIRIGLKEKLEKEGYSV